MGDKANRQVLADRLNRAFSTAQIANSARTVKKLSPRADFLDISNALGALEHLKISNMRSYRARLALPPVVQRILTHTYRAALFNTPKPTPLRIQIKQGRRHSVAVGSTASSISVVLTRPDPKLG
jgi:hypothetical protein